MMSMITIKRRIVVILLKMTILKIRIIIIVININIDVTNWLNCWMSKRWMKS